MVVDCEYKLIAVMNSLFRLNQIVELKAPDIIKQTEMDLLQKRFSKLTAEDIYKLFKIWPEFYAKKKNDQIIDDFYHNKSFDTFIKSDLN